MFEYAVRPFQSRDTFGRAILPSTPSGSLERATLTWGSSASLPPATLPTPTTMGVNVACCQELRTQDGSEKSAESIVTQGSSSGSTRVEFHLQRSIVVLAKRQERNTCNDWLMQNSSVASGVSTAFSELSALIHASDSSFRPAGSAGECRETTNYNYVLEG